MRMWAFRTLPDPALVIEQAPQRKHELRAMFEMLLGKLRRFFKVHDTP